MSLRALSSLLMRRFSPRRTPAAQVQTAQAETIGWAALGRPTRSIHTLSNPDAAVGAAGALSVAGLAALVGFLYLKKDGKVGEVTDEGASTVVEQTGTRASTVVVTGMRTALNDPAITAMFTADKDGNIDWNQYYGYLLFRWHYLDRFRKHYLDRKKIAVTDKEARSEVPDSVKLPLKQVGNVMKVDEAALKKIYEETAKKTVEEYKNNEKMIMEQEYKVDEAVMKKRFEDWMQKYGRTYKFEKEKARRYEAFKVNAIISDKRNAHAQGDARFAPNIHGDWTEDEFRRLNGSVVDSKLEVELWRTMYAEGRPDYIRRNDYPPKLGTDALKKSLEELRARKAEQERQAKQHQPARRQELQATSDQ